MINECSDQWKNLTQTNINLNIEEILDIQHIGSTRFSEILLNFSERQILVPELQVYLRSGEKCKKFRKTSTSLASVKTLSEPNKQVHFGHGNFSEQK